MAPTRKDDLRESVRPAWAVFRPSLNMAPALGRIRDPYPTRAIIPDLARAVTRKDIGVSGPVARDGSARVRPTRRTRGTMRISGPAGRWRTSMPAGRPEGFASG